MAGQGPQPVPKARIGQQPRRIALQAAENARIRIMRRRMADAAKPRRAGRQMRLQHRRHRFAQQQIGMADDARTGTRRPIQTTGGHRGHTIDELSLPHWAQRRRPIRAVERPAFQKNGRHDIVAAAHVGQQLVKQVKRAERDRLHKKKHT
jgi:hypothetical protein